MSCGAFNKYSDPVHLSVLRSIYCAKFGTLTVTYSRDFGINVGCSYTGVDNVSPTYDDYDGDDDDRGRNDRIRTCTATCRDCEEIEVLIRVLMRFVTILSLVITIAAVLRNGLPMTVFVLSRISAIEFND